MKERTDISGGRLLFVVNHPDFFLSHRLPLAVAAREAGMEVALASSRTDAVQGVFDNDITWFELPLEPGGLSPIADAACFKSLVGLYRRWQPDIVHHVTMKPILYGGMAARIAGVPGVIHAFSGLGYTFMDPTWKGSLLRLTLTRLLKLAANHPGAVVILQNADDREELVSRGIVDPNQVELIRGSGVDVSRYPWRPEPAGPAMVMLPTRMLWDKGVGEFVEAARRLKREGLEARFVLVGAPDSNNPSAIDPETLRSWDQDGAVEWWGFRDDMPSVYEQAHVVCLPSYREGLPKSLLEAAATGRALVATDVPGCREVVLDGENGLIVPARDAVGLAHAIRTLVEQSGRRAAMGRRSRELAEEHFALSHVVDQTLAIYSRMLQPESHLTATPNHI